MLCFACISSGHKHIGKLEIEIREILFGLKSILVRREECLRGWGGAATDGAARVGR